jgi:4-amino-4-deoxy-L-arabinose transferase-like glycosyltransferase
MALRPLRSRITRWRQPPRAARLARALWIAWAVVVWNVVFDHVIVVAGRSYIAAAVPAAAAGMFANMDDWMRPAVTRGVWIATAAGAAILLSGLAAVDRAARRQPR